ncbi:sigma-70 family RNA polymerase sigma factor [Echinicola sediminis]
MKIQEFSPSNEQVNDLWEQLIRGEKRGLEGIYRVFSKELFLYGVSIFEDQDFVQDCIQDVFIELWKYHKNLQRADNVKVYLFKALSYKMFRESKKKSKRSQESLDTLSEQVLVSPSIESQLIARQVEESLRHKIAGLMQKLPERQKEVIYYLFFENLSYEEVSKIMGINIKSVYTLAWKAISALKKKVGKLMVWIILFMSF